MKHVAISLITGILLFTSFAALAESNSKGPNSPVCVAVLTAVSKDGAELTVLQDPDIVRKLPIGKSTTVEYVGFPKRSDCKLVVGYGVKARVNKDGSVKLILLTPPIPDLQKIGDERLKMTPEELFKRIDVDNVKGVSYPEFAALIYPSPKHAPDTFRKYDKKENGVLDENEFKAALETISWWRLSRKTPEAWFKELDRDKNGVLLKDEFVTFCGSNHLDAIFKRSDKDRSGGIDLKETEAYLRASTKEK